MKATVNVNAPGASCINVAHAQNGHRNVRTLFFMRVFGFIQNKLGINICAVHSTDALDCAYALFFLE